MNIAEISKKLMQSACDFQAISHEARDKCRDEFRKNESNEQNVLRISVDGTVAALSEKTSHPIMNVSDESSYQIGLSASFIRSYFVVTDHLMNGDLIEGLVLLRKQLELLARIFELEDQKVSALRKKTPNIKYLLINGAGRIYGQLSEVAHFSTPEAAEMLGINSDGVRYGPSLIPNFRESAYGYMDLSHFTGVRFSQWMLGKLRVWHPDMDLSLEHDLVYLAISNAVNAGVLEVSERPNA
jgi:hypothetical protein